MSISIEIEDPVPVATLLKEILEQRKPLDVTLIHPMERSGPSIIYRVPANIREANESLYEPRVVSIGPYYHHLREYRLREMEDQKLHLLSSFLCRKSEIPLEAYVKELQLLEEQVRESYSETIAIESNDFVQMLLLDGCFILEHFLKWQESWNNGKELNVLLRGNWTMILSDLVLSENQIPLVVIERLYDIAKTGEESYNRNEFLTNLEGFLMNHKHRQNREWPQTTSRLSHIYHDTLIREIQMKVYCPTVRDLSGRRLKEYYEVDDLSMWFEWAPQIPSATELDEVGVKFRKMHWLKAKSPFHVEFNGGIFDIPPMQISSDTKVFLANLVEVERHYRGPDQVVTSYVALMDSLIKRKKDVVLLQHARIINNKLASDQEAVDFFRQLSDATDFDAKFQFFKKLFKEMRMYYNSGWNRHRTTFVRSYCNNPCTAMLVIAGVILLGLTGLLIFLGVFSSH